MKFEVEQKHDVPCPAELVTVLDARGVVWLTAEQQADTYYSHPARDFRQTDEALRIRCVAEANFVTYKGPKLDSTSKTRRELELPLASGAAGRTQFAELLTALGFVRVAEVRKIRRPFTVENDGRSVQGALDEVDGLGTFLELELTADQKGLGLAQANIAALAGQLPVGASETRSYLELLQEKRREA